MSSMSAMGPGGSMGWDSSMLAVQTSMTHNPAAAASVQGVSMLYYRPLCPHDFEAMKAAHSQLFPIDYDDSFYDKAIRGQDRIFSWAAFRLGPFGQEVLVGFVTARTTQLHECDTTDRAYMGLTSMLLDHDRCVYILTLGVVDGFRNQGIASQLIQLVIQHAQSMRCRAVFLHVISYNTAAMSLYSRHNFQCAGRLRNFYHIGTGRQPDPTTVIYDAYLYVQYLYHGDAMYSPWDVLQVAWSPVRTAWARLQRSSCMPQLWQQRQQVHQFPSVPKHQVMPAVGPYQHLDSMDVSLSHGQQERPQCQEAPQLQHWDTHAAEHQHLYQDSAAALLPAEAGHLHGQQQWSQQHVHPQQQKRTLRWLFNPHIRRQQHQEQQHRQQQQQQDQTCHQHGHHRQQRWQQQEQQQQERQQQEQQYDAAVQHHKTSPSL